MGVLNRGNIVKLLNVYVHSNVFINEHAKCIYFIFLILFKKCCFIMVNKEFQTNKLVSFFNTTCTNLELSFALIQSCINMSWSWWLSGL